MLKKFGPNDIFYSQIKTYPQCRFITYDRKVYYNDNTEFTGAFTSSVRCTSPGHISLYELNVDRNSTQLIYPFVTKEGSLTTFKTATTNQFNTDFSYGDTLSGSYPLTASISRDYYPTTVVTRSMISAMRNTLNRYRIISPAYAYSPKDTQNLSLISVPSIFYGSSIKKGTVDLKFYITGTLIGQAQDIRQNGEIIQTGPTGSNGSGSVAGVVLYKEGFLILTGAWDISEGAHTEKYVVGAAATSPKWLYFGTTGSATTLENVPSSSFITTFEGTNYIPTMTLFTHASKGELNHSNNPTYKLYDQNLTAVTSSKSYREQSRLRIKNTVESPYADPTGSFRKQTYISKVGIYDENKNLIMIAKLATPLRKREIDDYTIKITYDF